MSEKITDLFGVEHYIPEKHYDEPTQAWVEGWMAYMYHGLSVNPYELGDAEYSEWQDGYEAAEKD